MPKVSTRLAALAAPVLLIAAPAIAQSTMTTPPSPVASSPSDYVKMAGASDKFEITEAKVMMTSANPDIRKFARQMVTDHTKSTTMVKSAAMRDKVKVMPPMLRPDQQQMVAALKAEKGTSRDQLYLQQQKAAHQEALQLHQSYASSGSADALKATAAQIAPVVQSHIDMLNGMNMSGM